MARQKLSEVEKAQRAMARALEKEYAASSSILQQGDRFIITEFMDVPTAIRTLQKFQEEQNDDVQHEIRITGHPHDILINFNEALRERFGRVMADSQVMDGWFGQMVIPGKSMTIQTGPEPNDTISVPYGGVSVPGLPITFHLRADWNDEYILESSVRITFEYVRKYEPLIKDIEADTRQRCTTHSIFKGKAIDSEFNFIKTTSKIPVVYSQEELDTLDITLFTPIRDTETVEQFVPIKRTTLLKGPYGVGKTLTAIEVAKLCEQHDWTFIMVSDNNIVNALRTAKEYEPCVVFMEDVDAATGEARRSARLNKILNEIDGALGKDSRIMTILTTNHVEEINQAMLRPGRIDHLVEMGKLDAEAVGKMVRAYAGELLSGEIDPEQLHNISPDYTPAFVAEAVKRAGLKAISRKSGNGGEVTITQEDLVVAYTSLKPQYELMVGEQKVHQDSLGEAMSNQIDESVKRALKEVLPVFNDCAFKE